MKCKHIGNLTGGKYDNLLDSNKRVYSTEYIAPTITTCNGGYTEPKILDEPIIYDDFNSRVKADQSTVGSLTTNCGNGAPRTGVKLIEPNYRVRKLTERECFKLMGVKQKDFEKIRENQSKSSCYHLAGDSIVSTVLMAIFGQMFDIDYEQKIKETVGEILQGNEKLF